MKNCRYCKNEILDEAIVCHYCNRNQNIFLRYFRVEWIGVAISIAMMTIAFQQLNVARTERQEVAQALDQAQTALKTAENVKKKALDLEKETKLDSLRYRRKSANNLYKNLRSKVINLGSNITYGQSAERNSEAFKRFQEMGKLNIELEQLQREIDEFDTAIKAIKNGTTNIPAGKKLLGEKQ